MEKGWKGGAEGRNGEGEGEGEGGTCSMGSRGIDAPVRKW